MKVLKLAFIYIKKAWHFALREVFIYKKPDTSESLLNPYARLDARLHPGLDSEVGSSLDEEYSVTQLLPGDYYYVKWWGGGPIPLSNTKEEMTKVKDASGTKRRNSRVFTFTRILGTLKTPTRPSYLFLRVWTSSVRGSPKSRLCLVSALATA